MSQWALFTVWRSQKMGRCTAGVGTSRDSLETPPTSPGQNPLSLAHWMEKKSHTWPVDPRRYISNIRSDEELNLKTSAFEPSTVANLPDRPCG